MVGFLGSKVTLVCLRQSTRVSFMGWLDTPTLFSGLNAWRSLCLMLSMRSISGSRRPGIVRGDHTHLACL